MSSEQVLYDRIKQVTSSPLKPEEERKINKAVEENTRKSVVVFLNEVKTLKADRQRPVERLQRVQHISEVAKLPTAIVAEDSVRKYRKLLEDALAAASRGSAAIDELTETLPAVLKHKEYNVPTKAIEAIKSIREGIAPDAKVDKLLADFEKLSNDVKDYALRVDAEIKEKKTKQAEDLAKLVKEVNEINSQIDAIDVNVMEPLMEFLKLGTGSFKNISTGTPAVAFTALLTSVGSGLEKLVDFKAELDRKDAKRKRLEEQRKEKKLDIEKLENEQSKTEDTTFIPECLRSVYTDIAELGPRISGFLNVKKELPRDLDALVALLKVIPSDVRLTDDTDEAVQNYQQKYDLVTSLQDINQRGLQEYIKPL